MNPPASDAALRLEPSLRIGDVAARREVLLRHLDGRAAVRIDVGGLQSVDTAGVQLLLALRLEADRRGIEIEYRGDSPALSHGLQLLGLKSGALGRCV